MTGKPTLQIAEEQRERELITTDEAVRRLRSDPACAGLVRDAYLGRDVADSARRFHESGEFAEVRRILGPRLLGATILDLGAGCGMASHAFAASGAARVVAVDPDPSDEVGRGAMARLAGSAGFEIVDGFGEAIPLDDASVDIVYCRQVLHHARNLPQVLRECARVVKPGGIVLACREHVVDDDKQLAEFLADHPVNRLAGGENAHHLTTYLAAITDAGLEIDRVYGPWQTVINAFPVVRTQAELEAIPAARLARRFGRIGRAAARVPGVQTLIWRRIDTPVPGRMYSFLAHRPA
jgi:2-polyprenyl-3-methyl-5-hydroxy-6-metoxy-1,4-benzoquinol methylase